MSYLQGSFPIIEKESLAKDVYSLRVSCPPLAAQALPGQFVNIRLRGFSLRRPISICDFQGEVLRLVFQVRGDGTRELAALEPGDCLDLLGPLGNGFPPLPDNTRVVLVGGGIGTPPLLSLARRYGKNATALLGFRNLESIILKKDFQAFCDTRIATDDGSYGLHGAVSELLKDRMEDPVDMIFACGPTPMLKYIVYIAQAFDLPVKISVEERMACGVGACLVCACRTVRDGQEIFSRVCADGPVFDGKEVVFE